MIARPDGTELRTFLARASRRLAWTAAAEGAAAGLAFAFALSLAGWPERDALSRSLLIGGGFAVTGIVARVLMVRRRGRRVAALVERRAPQCRNLVVTADEIQDPRRPGASVAEPIAALVYAQAAKLVNRLDLAALFPARNAIMALGLSGTLWALAVAHLTAPLTGSASHTTGAGTETNAMITGVEVAITPPAYTARPAQSWHDPTRIEALAGSRVRVTVHADAQSVFLETLRGRFTLARPSGAVKSGTFTADLPADADGFIALEPTTADGRAGVRRLIGLSVIADNAPRVRVTAPGKDLFLRDAHHTIDITVDASDDIGLASLRVRYTKVSGSGERFTFTEGDVPLEIARADARTWTARAQWRLDALGLTPGDMVVYRAVAADYRPGAPASESDSFIAEIVAPGGEAAPGFALDPEQERYAVSQQMVIIETERLAARRPSMQADAFRSAAQDIAAEQRKVRAEFVFMMGGELEDSPDVLGSMTDIDEVAEAEGESDLAAGRMANQGRIALLRAIRSMSRATAALTSADLPPALTHERAALTQLERAFSRTRIILRALTERERLDLSRRLTGVLTDVTHDVHPSVDPDADPRVSALRRSLSGIAALSGAGASRFPADASARASMLAQSVLEADPSAKSLQDVAEMLNAAAGALGAAAREGGVAADRTNEARTRLDRAATRLAAVLRTELLDAPTGAPSVDLSRLEGALTDALRHPGSRR